MESAEFSEEMNKKVIEITDKVLKLLLDEFKDNPDILMCRQIIMAVILDCLMSAVVAYIKKDIR